MSSRCRVGSCATLQFDDALSLQPCRQPERLIPYDFLGHVPYWTDAKVFADQLRAELQKSA